MTEETVSRLQSKIDAARREVGKAVVGQGTVIEQILVGLFAGGHCLLEGVPGVGKTLLVRSLAAAIHSRFSRIQFTPDLMPTDITGTEVLHDDPVTRERSFRFLPGPLFANLVLSDEINRTPPKTQSALLEAMQEGHVTVGGKTYPLPQPFFVLATQNPIEQAGTYPLPEAQLDRFLLYIRVPYPSAEDEVALYELTTGEANPLPEASCTGDDILAIRSLVRQVHVSPAIVDYVARLVRATRPGRDATAYVNEHIRWGAGPRAGQAILLTAKARAFIHGRFAVQLEDIASVGMAALVHRVLPSYHAEALGVSAGPIVDAVVNEVAKPKDPLR
jgi:MoxR-like ATPase